MIVLGRQFNVGPKGVNVTAAPSALPRREEPTVIQQEGWLMKRGAGFRQPGQDAAPFPSGGSSIEEDNMSSMRRGSFRGPSSLSTLFHGKDEKRRYFILLTTPASSSPKEADPTKSGPTAELRYYKTRPETAPERQNPKGSIIITADMDVTLEDSVIHLFAANRTYYLRPDFPEGQTAKVKTSAAQWINAIRFALNGLRAYELQGAVGVDSMPHPLQDRRSIRINGLTGLNEERKAARRSFTSTKPIEGKPSNNVVEEPGQVCLFAELWHLEGIEAYERVVAHFGVALTDFQRMRDHFQSRVDQVVAELAILDQELGHAADVVVKEQRTIADAMKELHKSSQKHAFALRECNKDTNTRVLAAIDNATREISTKLETIVNRSSTAASYVEGAKKALMEAIERVDKLQEQLEHAIIYGTVSETQKGNASRNMLRRKSEGPPPDPAKIEIELNEARQQRRDASQTLVTTETKQAEAISRAMDELYKLEQLRLERIVSILEAASDIENRYVEKMTLETSGMESALDQIDAPKDIRATFARLKAAAEKTREKPRRKNSLYNRVDFSKLNVEGDTDA